MDWKRTLNQIFWIVLAVGVGIGGAVSAQGDDGVQLTTAGLVGLGYAALRIGMQWYAANRPDSSRAKKILGIILLCAILPIATGCAFHRPHISETITTTNYDDTGTVESIDVTKTTVGVTDIITAGKQDTASDLRYTGDGWDFGVNDAASQDATDVLAVVTRMIDMAAQAYGQREAARASAEQSDAQGPTILDVIDLVRGIADRLSAMETEVKSLK